MIKLSGIHWLAGLLEGEGSFYLQTHHRLSRKLGYHPKHAIIKVGMTDRDVVERAHNILGSTHKIESSKYTINSGKIMYVSKLSGNAAIQWMMTLYSLMGNRRKLKIEEILFYWKYHKEGDRRRDEAIPGSILYTLNSEGKLIGTAI